MKKIDVNYFPGWTRKSVTFTLDDGNLETDGKFINIIKPYGIKGTFNLCWPDFSALDAEGYRDFYRGYEIANHCKHHPIVFDDGMPYNVSDDEFNSRTSDDYTPDNPVVYKTWIEGLYRIHHHVKRIKPDGWYSIATPEHYISFASDSRKALEAIFGEGSVSSFVWPCFEQKNTKVIEYLKKNYKSVRKTGELRDSTGFSLPSDRWAWSYNANHRSLNDVMSIYESFVDDGKLKFFCFGVHSHDFRTSDNWEDLEYFAKTYGNRPEDYYYASVGDILAYEDAVKSVEITDDRITNRTDLTLYIKVDGERIVLEPKSYIDI